MLVCDICDILNVTVVNIYVRVYVISFCVCISLFALIDECTEQKNIFPTHDYIHLEHKHLDCSFARYLHVKSELPKKTIYKHPIIHENSSVML